MKTLYATALAGFGLFLAYLVAESYLDKRFAVQAPIVQQAPPTPAPAPPPVVVAVPPRPPSPVLPQGCIAGPADSAMTKAVGYVVVGVDVGSPLGLAHVRIQSGSCFAVTSSGYLITNRHVVDMTDDDLQDVHNHFGPDSVYTPRVWTFFGDDEHDGQVVYKSDTFDLAVIKIGHCDAWFRLAGSCTTGRDTDVCAAGFPGIGSDSLGRGEIVQQAQDISDDYYKDIRLQLKARDFAFTLTKGIVSRVVHDEADGQVWIQHEAVIRHGNSGGPLISADGIAVGINTWAQHRDGDVQTNNSLEISQMRSELNAHIGGILWTASGQNVVDIPPKWVEQAGPMSQDAFDRFATRFADALADYYRTSAKPITDRTGIEFSIDCRPVSADVSGGPARAQGTIVVRSSVGNHDDTHHAFSTRDETFTFSWNGTKWEPKGGASKLVDYQTDTGNKPSLEQTRPIAVEVENSIMGRMAN